MLLLILKWDTHLKSKNNFGFKKNLKQTLLNLFLSYLVYKCRSFLNELYTNPIIYTNLGLEICICMDIGLAKGGTESIKESFHSAMKSQTMYGGQSNEVISLRTKLEWSLPPVIQAKKVVEGTARIYLDGDKSKEYPSHKWPIIGDRTRSRHRIRVATLLKNSKFS